MKPSNNDNESYYTGSTFDESFDDDIEQDKRDSENSKSTKNSGVDTDEYTENSGVDPTKKPRVGSNNMDTSKITGVGNDDTSPTKIHEQ